MVALLGRGHAIQLRKELLAVAPAMLGGQEVSGVRLRFESGKVVDATAERGEDEALGQHLADQPPAPRTNGEVAG